MTAFKHTAGIIEAHGWLSALDQAFKDGLISAEAAEFLAGQSGTNAGKLLSGEAVDGKKLTDLSDYEEAFEAVFSHLNATKQGYPNA